MRRPVVLAVGFVLLIGVVVVLFEVVFPWVDANLVSNPLLER